MNKILTTLYFVLFAAYAMAQETTVTVEKLDDSTFVEKTILTNTEGLLLKQENKYYNINDFAAVAINTNQARLEELSTVQSNVITVNRDINSLRVYIIDSIGINYDSLVVDKLFPAFSGDWQFIEKNGSTVNSGVNIRRATSPLILRMRQDDNSRAWNIKPVHSKLFELRNYDVEGTGETVEMLLSNNQYRGRASNGTVLILRR